MENKKTILKICIIGDSGVGKTSLIMRYIKGDFNEQYRITVGADLFSQEVAKDNKQYMLQVWDTAGQEKFRSIGSAFYRGSDACVLVYDTSNEKSFKNLDNWRQEFINQGGIQDDASFPFVVLGSKCDKEGRQIDLAQAEEYCKQKGFSHFETSAKEDKGIKEAFDAIIEEAIKNYQQEDFYIPPQIALQDRKQQNQSNCCQFNNINNVN